MRLHIENVGKCYRGGIWGVRDVNLELSEGILGLLGPNGAGKSSLLRILATVTRPSEGKVLWEGVDTIRYPNRLRKVLGYLPQEFGIYPHLTAREFLQYLAATKGISGRAARQRIAHLLDLVNLTSAANRLMGTLSGGMKQRVGIAQALLNDPRLLIIDEPTAGLDPEERVRFRNLLAELAGDRLVIMSSHIVSDIASAANQVAVIRMGRLIACATPDTLLTATQGKVWEMTLAASELPEARRRLPISSAVWNATGVRVRILAEESPGQEARRVEPNLEDAYLYLLSSHQQTRIPV